MKDEAVPPHYDGNGVVAECKTVGTDEQPLRLREEPDTQDE